MILAERLRAPARRHVRTVRVRVKGGYQPSVVHARAGEPLRIVFTREETASCSEHVVFPAFGKSAMLPAFEDVALDLLPERAGEYEFTCQMGMLRGRRPSRAHQVDKGSAREAFETSGDDEHRRRARRHSPARVRLLALQPSAAAARRRAVPRLASRRRAGACLVRRRRRRLRRGLRSPRRAPSSSASRVVGRRCRCTTAPCCSWRSFSS